MKYLSIILFLFCLVNKQHAQNVKDGWVYGDSGTQVSTQCHIDRVGNRYQIIWHIGDLRIDSNGYPIIIPKSVYGHNIAVIKFDSKGKYLYHLSFRGSNVANGIYNFDLKFTSTNEVILGYYTAQNDSINLVDAKGVFYKTITPPKFKTSQASQNSIILLCKLNANGQFVWTNLIARENPKMHNGFIYFERFCINKSDQISVFFPNNSRDSTFNFDTLSVTNTSNQKSVYPISTKYVLVKFNSAGNLLVVKEPLKNLLLYPHADTSFQEIKTLNTITDGWNTYCIFRFRINKLDTIQMGSPQPLNVGFHYLLFKLNEQDSIVWVKKIARQKFQHWHMSRIDYDTIRHELALSASYHTFFYDFYLNPSFSSSNSGAYVCKMNVNGTIIWEDFISGYDPRNTIVSLNFNYVSNQLQLIGFPDINDAKLKSFFPFVYNNQLNAVIASVDNNSNSLVSANAFAINSLNASYANSWIGLNFFKIGSPIIDPKGRTYISGAFVDSITLPCRKFKAVMETNSWGSPLTDAFVLVSEPYFSKDTGICKQMISPSGKFVWDSTGTYTDTLTNSLGCDSIVFFHVRLRGSKSTLDSSVCNAMLSYSGKYTWDSTGTYFDTIPNAFGCDSIIKLKLTILSRKITIDTSVKYSFNSPSGKHIWDSSGVYIDSVTQVNGCLNIITINLKVLSTRSRIDTFNCMPIKYLSRSEWINISGVYLDTIPNSQAGDSLLTIHFTRTATIDTLYYNQCESLLLPSGKLKVVLTGQYLDTLTTRNGCDSVIFINYTNLSSFSQLSYAICDSLVSPSGKFIYTSSGTYLDTLINQFGCDSLITLVIEKSISKLKISKSNDIDCNNPFSQLNADGALNYKWMPPDGLSNDILNNPKATPKNSITYYLIATDSLGCIFTDSIFINVHGSDSLGFFPNIFTPNGDGINDCLPLNSLTKFNNINFIVFNRWGNKVFETSDLNLCWNGEGINGEKLSEGVYFFILEGKTNCNKDLSINGTITIIK
jgi:gliding motility-associated-like protein